MEPYGEYPITELAELAPLESWMPWWINFYHGNPGACAEGAPIPTQIFALLSKMGIRSDGNQLCALEMLNRLHRGYAEGRHIARERMKSG